MLTALLKHAKLVGVLNGETEFTVFASQDDASGRLPAETIESLFQPENKELLTTILTYHVVPGSVSSTQLSSGAFAASVAGAIVASSLTFSTIGLAIYLYIKTLKATPNTKLESLSLRVTFRDEYSR